MHKCPQMEWIIDRLGDDLTDSDREAIAEHLAQCPLCAGQLQRMARLAPAIAQAAGHDDDPQDHFGDNDLAAFVAHGYDAEGASAIALHLSRCRRCRDAFVAAHSALLRYEAEHDAPPWWRRFLGEVRMALGNARSAALLLLAAVAYLAECLLFAVAIGQMLFAWVIPPAGYEALPQWWPLTLLPAGPWRLALVLILCVAGALALRAAARALYRAAIARSRSEAR